MSRSAFVHGQYGWGVVYWLIVEGIPVIWSERDTGLGLPSGFTTLDPRLMVDRSADVGQEVDRNSGIGKGLPFTFGVLDSNVSRTLFRRPTLVQGQLAADLTATATSVDVADNLTSWPSSGMFWIGTECITYSSKSGSGDNWTLSGLTRGVAYSLPSIHAASSSVLLSDLPTSWRGRLVRLYATPIDPNGWCPGEDLLDEAEMVWLGYVDRGPTRVGSAWSFDCLSLERRLELPLGQEQSGVVVGTQKAYPVDSAKCFTITARGMTDVTTEAWSAVSVTAYPFADLPADSHLTIEDQIARIVSSWDAAVTAAGLTAHFGALELVQEYDSTSWIPKDHTYAWMLRFNGSDCTIIEVSTLVGGKLVGFTAEGKTFISGSDLFAARKWLGIHSGPQILDSTVSGTSAPPALLPPTLQLLVDMADSPVDVPTKGTLVFGDGATATLVQYSQAVLYSSPRQYAFGELKQNNNNWIAPAALLQPGVGVKVRFVLEGNLYDCMLKLLESSGAGNRGDRDILAYCQGYALAAIDSGLGTSKATVDTDLAALGDLVSQPVRVDPAGKSFAELFGPLLALRCLSMAVTSRLVAGKRQQVLTVVRTSVTGADYVKRIADADLLLGDGAVVEPVNADPPLNSISVRLANGDGQTVLGTDEASIAENGSNATEWQVPLTLKPDQSTGQPVAAWILERFAAGQFAQVVMLKLTPWAAADIALGDLIKLDTSHYSVWSWGSGSDGFAGFARVLSRPVRLADGVVQLKVLIDGNTVQTSLCPAMEVHAWAGSAGAPTSIDVERRFLPLLQQLYAADGDFVLRHFKPGCGDEGANQSVTVRGVTDTGTYCRLDILSVSSTVLVAHKSWLTFAIAANASPYQAAFAHVDNGAIWGA